MPFLCVVLLPPDQTKKVVFPMVKVVTLLEVALIRPYTLQKTKKRKRKWLMWQYLIGNWIFFFFFVYEKERKKEKEREKERFNKKEKKTKKNKEKGLYDQN